MTVKKGSTVLDRSGYSVTYKKNKSVGQASVTVKLKGNYTGSKTVYFKIRPKGTALGTLTAASKAVTVKWEKQATEMSYEKITGYQVQLATDSGFTENVRLSTISGYTKLSKTVTGLKGAKQYYVRVRTYKEIDGNKYYSKWSEAKTVTTKK